MPAAATVSRSMLATRPLSASSPNRLLLTHVWVWLLLIVPVEDMLVYLRQRLYRRPTADTARMQRLTLLPSALWAVILLGGTVAALVYGGDLLLHRTR